MNLNILFSTALKLVVFFLKLSHHTRLIILTNYTLTMNLKNDNFGFFL